MLTGRKEIDDAITDLTTEIILAIRTGNPKDDSEGVAIERAFATLVTNILKQLQQPPFSHAR